MGTVPRGTLDPWFVTGFLEAAGAFTYSRSGKQVVLYFAVKTAAEDVGLLQDLCAFFGGAGRIYEVSGKAGRRSSYYRVCRRQDLASIVRHFDAHPLRGTRAAAYGVWWEMVAVKQEFRSADTARLATLAARLTATRSGR